MSQNRGKGTPTYRATSSRFKANLEHIKTFGDETIEGVITEVVHDTARNTPIVRVKFGNGEEKLILAPEGIGVGDKIAYGVAIEIKPGNTLPLSSIPDGCPICNIESQPGDGGAFARSSGVYAILVAHEPKRVVVQMPSGDMKWLSPKCRATIGVVAGGGRTEWHVGSPTPRRGYDVAAGWSRHDCKRTHLGLRVAGSASGSYAEAAHRITGRAGHEDSHR
jgi:large subunit ribosomal protein L2